MRKSIKIIIFGAIILVLGIIVAYTIKKNIDQKAYEERAFTGGKDTYWSWSKGTVIDVDTKKDLVVVSVVKDNIFLENKEVTLDCDEFIGFENLGLKKGDKITFYYFQYNINEPPIRIEDIIMENQTMD